MKRLNFKVWATAIVLALSSVLSVTAAPPLKAFTPDQLLVGANHKSSSSKLRQLANQSHPLRHGPSALQLRNAANPAQPRFQVPMKADAGGELFTLYAFNWVPYDGAFMQRGAYLGTLPYNPAGPFVTDYTTGFYGIDAVQRVGSFLYVFYKYPAEILGLDHDVKVMDIYMYETYDGEEYVEGPQEICDDATLGVNDETVAAEVAKCWGTSLTVDRVENQMYSLVPTATGYNLVKVNWTPELTPEGTVVGSMTGEWFSLVCDNTGQLYAIKITRTDGNVTGAALHKVSKTDASVTLVGDTGEKPYMDAGAAIDPNDNSMYWVVQENRDTASRLVKVSLSNGGTTTLYTYDYDTDEHPVGLFGYVAPNPNTPDVCTDLDVETDGPSLTCTFKFTAPVNTISGDPGDTSTELTWTASCEGVAKSGTCHYGEEVTVPMTVSTDGYFTFSVKVADGKLESNAIGKDFYIGRAVPPSAKPTLEYDEANLTFKVTWPEPNLRYVQGYLDVDNLTYTLTRYPGAVVVADKIKEREFTESCADFVDAQFGIYYYELLVYNDELHSSTNGSNGIASDAVPMGHIMPPFHEDFDKMSRTLVGYTVIDGNSDNNTWRTGIGNVMIYNPSSSNTMNDDWLITPKLYLERGKTYYFDTKASVNFRMPDDPTYELLQFYVGSQPTVEALRDEGQKLGEFKVIGGYDGPEDLRVAITPDETGIYYLGIRSLASRATGCGAAIIYPWDLSTGVAQGAPEAPVFKSIERQINGNLEATVTLTAPAKAIDGSALSAISRIDVMRAGNLVKTFENPAPGAELEPFVDYVDKPGDHSWTAVAYNDLGAGRISDPFTIFVGQDIAAAPSNFKVTETDWGKIHATWDKVTTDRNGNTIDPSRVTYRIDDYIAGTVYAYELTDNTADLDIIARHEPQNWKIFRIFALNESGNEYDRYSASDPMVIGAPLDEYRETWAKGYSDTYPTYTLWVQNYGAIDWGVSGYAVPGVFPHTGYAMLKLEGENVDDESSFITPRVDLSKQANPAFSFFTYGITDGEHENLNEVEIYARVDAKNMGIDEGWVLLEKKKANELADKHNWRRHVVSLANYKDKIVQIKVHVTIKNFINVLFDDLTIASIDPVDLGIDRVEAPEAVKPGEKFKVGVYFTNYGAEELGKYSVELDVNGNKTTLDGTDALKSGDKSAMTFEVEMPGYDDAEALDITATVKADGDAQADNNSISRTVDPELTRLPEPTAFTGALNDEGFAALSWAAPTATYYTPVAEKFDLGTPFGEGYNDWIFVDRDQAPVGKYYILFTIPNLVEGETKTSWTVWNGNGTQRQYGDYFLGVDDYYSIMSYYAEDSEIETDDWAISPELDGSAQTVSFMARGLFMAHPPMFDVYYSMGSTDPADFKALATNLSPLSGFWTPVYVRLPEGARRFAIRSRIKDSITMLQIDDVNYISAKAMDVSPKNYVLYRDGQSIETITDLAWTDTEILPGPHSYRVSAAYAGLGESAPTSAITLTQSDLATIAGGDITVSVSGRNIVVTGAEGKGINIYDTLGRGVFSGRGSSTTRVSVAPGVYLVIADGHTAKVIVR